LHDVAYILTQLNSIDLYYSNCQIAVTVTIYVRVKEVVNKLQIIMLYAVVC